MANYVIPETPQYSTEVRRLEGRDYADAEATFNPLFARLMENTAAVKTIGDVHAKSTDAHPAMQAQIAALDARLSLMELKYSTNVTGNPFTVTFDSLTGLDVTGVWNQPMKRIEF